MNNYFKKFKKQIAGKKIKLAVVGLGYVGLPLAVEFAKKGLLVLGIDEDRDRVNRLKNKQSYIIDVASRSLEKLIANHRLRVSASAHLLREAEVILICVPTPLKRKYHPDISFLKKAVSAVAKNIKKGALVIVESTTYPGTTQEVILPMLEKDGLRHNQDFYLCFSPERIDPGNAIFPLHRIPKIIGGLTKEAADLGKSLYGLIVPEVVVVSSPKVAETVKLLENTFRIVNIGFIDELAMMCHKMGIDIWEVIAAAKTKPFGFMPFYPGPGVGGHCIPKDPLYLYWKAKRFGFKSRFIKLASEIISFMPEYTVGRLCQILSKRKAKLNQAKVLVVGVTYKKDVKDLRKSPALDIIDILHKKNIGVSYYDPLIPYLKLGGINLKSIRPTADKLRSFNCVLIATDHSGIDYKSLLKNSSFILDTRNVFKNINQEKVIKL